MVVTHFSKLSKVLGTSVMVLFPDYILALVAGGGLADHVQHLGRADVEPRQLGVQWALSRKRDLSCRFRRSFTGATVLLLPRLLRSVLRLPAIVVVVEGHHVRVALDVVPVHALHAHDVEGVIFIKSKTFH